MLPLLLKVALTPVLVAFATLAGRRWGGRIAGWLVGFPFTSGPIALILTLQEGRRFAAAAALGTLLGTLSQALFAVAYGRLAGAGRGWKICFGAATAAFAAATLVLRAAHLGVAAAAVLVLASIAGALLLLPAAEAPAARPPGRYDLVARVAVATALVISLTSVAPLLGPQLTGLLTPFPLYASVLAVFSHRADGPAAGLAVVRGLALGLFGFGSFFLVLTSTLVALGAPAAFGLALLAVAGVQAATLQLLRRR